MDKIDTLLDAIEYTSNYSDEELEEMLADPLALETFRILDMLQAGLHRDVISDVDAEWISFRKSHSKSNSFLSKFISRKIVASVLIAVISLSGLAAIGLCLHTYYVSPTYIKKSAELENRESYRKRPDSEVKEIGEEINTIVFDNQPFDTIITDMAEYYGVKVDFRSNASNNLRLYFSWDQSLPVEEVVESLNNFEQLSIAIEDNIIIIL